MTTNRCIFSENLTRNREISLIACINEERNEMRSLMDRLKLQA